MNKKRLIDWPYVVGLLLPITAVFVYRRTAVSRQKMYEQQSGQRQPGAGPK
jgi:hypothetical protein